MAKSTGELTTDLGILTERTANLNRQVDQLQATLVRLEQSIASTREQQATLASRLEEFRKQYDESDRRRFTLLGLIVGAVLALVANLVVAYFRK